MVRSVGFLKEHKLDIGVLVMDRHTHSWMRENLSSTDHRYDAWELNLAVEPKIAIARILADLNWRFGTGTPYVFYASRKFWQILIWPLVVL